MGQLLISQAFGKYHSDWIVMKNQSKKTAESYSITCKLLIKFLGDIYISDLDFEDVKNWKQYLLSYQKPNSVRNHICNLRSVLRFLRSKNISTMNYEEIPVPNRQENQVAFLDEQEIEDFISVASRRVRGYEEINRLRNIACIRMIYATGLRVSELCSLDRSSIRRDLSFTMIGKGGKRRLGFLDQKALEAVNNYLAVRTDNNPALFVSMDGKEVNRLTPGGLRRVFKFICKNSYFDNITPHTIRHSYATHMLRSKVSIRYVADLMGHSSLDTTMRYTHIVNEDLREAYRTAFNN